MKILIVDDDQNILDMIKRTISWDALSIDEVMTALNGETALKLVCENEPDIVITDIEMPVMDGIELARNIVADRAIAPELIFLTAHADFAYARQAVQLGAADYLLKPFLPKDLTALLSRVVVRCNGKKAQESLAEKGALFEESRDYLTDSFLRLILERPLDGGEERLARAASRRNIEFDVYLQHRIIALSCGIAEKLSEYSAGDIQFIFRNIICELFFGEDRDRGEYYIDYIDGNSIRVYILSRAENRARTELLKKCTDAAEALRLFFGFQILCVISEPVSAGELALLRERIDSVLSFDLTRKTDVIFLDELSGEESAVGRINQREIAAFLRERKKYELFAYMRRFLEQHERLLNPEEMKVVHHDLMQIFYGYLYEVNISAHSFMEDELGRRVQACAERSSVDMLKYVTYMYDCIMSCIDEVKRSESVIEKAKKYIDRHYAENIGRAEIAEKVMLAPNYLSMLFRRTTGKTLREYINMCRVEEAKRLLSTTDNSVTEVAMQAGFDNISYFSTIFKKYTALSPVEYRNGLRERSERERRDVSV